MRSLENFVKGVHPSMIALSLFLFLSVITAVPIYRDAVKLEEIYLAQTTHALETLVRSTNRDLSHIAQIIFDLRIDRAEIVEIMARASETSDPRRLARLRERLYKELYDVYRYLRGFHIRQLHFHLPGPVSFLRFHKPDKFGDSLKGVRASLDAVQGARHAIHCFEEGRVFNGFRHVFPLWYEGRFVGSVEISFDAGAAIRAIVKTLPANAEFIILKDLVDEKVWRSERTHYRPSLFSERYLVDDAFRYKKTPIARRIYQDLGMITHEIKTEIAKRMAEGDAFSIYVQPHGTTYLVTLLPIQNCRGEAVAYLVVYQLNDFFEKHHQSVQRTIALALILNLLAALLIYRFVREERRLVHRLSAYATTDPLTGVLNRRAFLAAARNIIVSNRRHGLPTSLLFFDIDHFKEVNDRYGHDMGDEVLRCVAKLAKERLRENDLLARCGGEEFVVLLDGTGLEGAMKVAEALRRSVAENEIVAQRLKVTISLGVIQIEGDENLEQAIERVDMAMYRAKKQGRNRVIGDMTMH
jgi:diguanylate cyclase (GGDEF)-like protein